MELYKNRTSLLIWLILPIIFVWFSIGYLVSVNYKPIWAKSVVPKLVQKTNNSALTPPKIEKLSWNGEGLVTLWFDDAWESQFTFAYPKLEKSGLKGVLAVPTGMVNYDSYMSWNQIMLIAHNGWEITSHTRNHSCKPEQLTDEYVKAELVGAYNDLAEHNIYATNYVSPCGVDSPAEIKYAKENYLSLRTSYEGFNSLPVSDPYSLKVQAVERTTTLSDVQNWISQSKENHTWLILMFHQIDDIPENKYGTNYDTFSQIIELVKNSEIKVVSPTQALELVKADRTPTPNPTKTPTSSTLLQIEIKDSSVGYVNARSKPATADNIISKVYPGEKYDVLDEKSSWYQIVIQDPNEPKQKIKAWISYLYIKKI